MHDTSIRPGPTYEEMLHPRLPGTPVHQPADGLADNTPLQDLFRITWRDARGRVRLLRLPSELTGVDANILVLIGQGFPSGSHKIGPAYAALMEAELDCRLAPGATLVAPSTGNFGIGAAHVARLKGYRTLVLMPDGVSAERADLLRSYGAQVGTVRADSGGVWPLLQHTRAQYGRRPGHYLVNQFDCFANYRFHRHVTGGSALEAVADWGNGRIAAFVAAPGSAGTLAAADAIKVRFPEALTIAVEPAESPYLYGGGQGRHRIDGIGDALIPLIHNVRATDCVLLVPEHDCLWGLRAIQGGPAVLAPALGVPAHDAEVLLGVFGISGVCNVLGAIEVARALRLGAEDNVVTVATDGTDRYASVLAALDTEGAANRDALIGAARASFRRHGLPLLDLRPEPQKQRLLAQKEASWRQWGVQDAQLEAMRTPDFWEEEYARHAAYDKELLMLRERIQM